MDLWSLLDDADTRRISRRWIELPNGVSLHVVEREGLGAPVICLHGIWDWWGYFLPLATAEPKPFAGRPLIMVDLRGHGDSSKPERDYGLNDYASDIVALIPALRLERVGLLGHSLGALTALMTAATTPAEIDLLVLEDPPLPLPKSGSDMFRGVYELRSEPLDVIAEEFRAWRPWVTEKQALESALCLQTTADGVFTATFDGEFNQTDVPVPEKVIAATTLVIQAGNEDQRALRPAGVQLLEAVCPALTVITIPRTSHTVLRDDPAAYLGELQRFFGRDA